MKGFYLGQLRNVRDKFAIFAPIYSTPADKTIKLEVSEKSFCEAGDFYVVSIDEKTKEELMQNGFALIIVYEGE